MSKWAQVRSSVVWGQAGPTVRAIYVLLCPLRNLYFYPVGASSGVHVEGPLKGVKHRKDIIRSACLNTSAS